MVTAVTVMAKKVTFCIVFGNGDSDAVSNIDEKGDSGETCESTFYIMVLLFRICFSNDV